MSFDFKISKGTEEFTSVQLLFNIQLDIRTGDLLCLVHIQEMPMVSACLAHKPLLLN